MDIEKEVQARVEFKMNEFLIAIKNTAKTNWNIAFQTGHPKYSYYWEAFSQMEGMFKKEIQMGLPYDEMSELNRRKKRDEAIEKIMEKFCRRGSGDSHDYYLKEKAVVKIIEDAQRW